MWSMSLIVYVVTVPHSPCGLWPPLSSWSLSLIKTTVEEAVETQANSRDTDLCLPSSVGVSLDVHFSPRESFPLYFELRVEA